MKSSAVVVIKREVTIQLPQLPNFVRDTDDRVISVGDLSKDELERIGAAWSAELVRHGLAKRNGAKTP